MPRLLTFFDYKKQIQDDNLAQILGSNYQILKDAEQAAQAEIISYLAQRYITSEVFTDTTIFSNSVVYYGKNLVYLDATAYSDTTIYLTGQLVLQAGSVYSSKAGNAAHAFNASEWDLLGAQYSFFYVKLPESEFNYKTAYVTGNKVWYANSVYTCLMNCTGIFPNANAAFWGTGTPYTVSGVLPTDTTKWTAGDNRNQQIVMYLIDITLYHLHSRINPRNVPDLRKERYNGNGPNETGGAIGWLKHVGSGDVTADLPNISPQQGVSISWSVANGYNSDGTYSISKNSLW